MTGNKEKFAPRLSDVLTRVILWLFIIFAAVLFVSSLTTTVFLDYGETTHILPQKILPLLLGVVLGGASLCLLYKKGLLERINGKKLFYICLSAVFLLSLILAFTTQNTPRADQLSVIEAAKEACAGGYTAFETGGYMNMYPHQLAYMLYVKSVVSIAGDSLYLVLRILNCIYLAGLYLAMFKITSLITESSSAVKLFTLIFALYGIPVLYTVFLYGDILSMALIAAELLFFIRFIKKSKLSDAALLRGIRGTCRNSKEHCVYTPYRLRDNSCFAPIQK